jgi:hypothetical protein
MAVGVAQGAEAHLVISPRNRRIAELGDFDELFAAKCPRPHHLNRRQVIGALTQHFEHVVTRLWTANAEDARELVRRCRVYREPIEVAVDDLDEDVSSIDDVRQKPSFRKRLGNAEFKCFV